MHVTRFLHKLLSPVIHLKRLNTLCLLIKGLLNDNKLSTTHLGRSLTGKAQEKNNIKRSDRFMGNKHLYEERSLIYRIISRLLIGCNKQPWIIIDWSHVPNTTHNLLRAALVQKGRALTLYESIHPQKNLGHPKVHKRFLAILKTILPSDCCPIIITDAGFGSVWFSMVESLGWHYLGRVRGNSTYYLSKDNTWSAYLDSTQRATSVPKQLGEGFLTKTNRFKTFFYLVKLPQKYRIALNKLKKKSHYKRDIEHTRAAKEPWLLASSLSIAPTLIVKMYAARMTIEEGFRDLKSSQFGFSFEHSYSSSIPRIQILLLIAMLASFIAFFTGWVGECNQWHYRFQANSYKQKRTLSLFYLGIRMIKKLIHIPIKKILSGIYDSVEEAINQNDLDVGRIL